MKKIRLTRNSYKRKLVMFGVSIFMSLSLTATGFAAWVLSKDVSAQQNGIVEVGTVTEANIGIENNVFVGESKFAFEPQEEDINGRVRNDGENFESLTVKLSWTVTNYSKVGTHTITFKVHENIKNAIDAGYITMPTGFTLTDATETIKDGEKDLKYYTATYTVPAVEQTANGVTTADGILKYTYNNGDNAATDEYTEPADSVSFELTLTFGWGEKFGNMNPGLYYDTNDTGKAVEYDNVKKELETFKAMVHGVTYEQYVQAVENGTVDQLWVNNPIYNYHVELKATVA